MSDRARPARRAAPPRVIVTKVRPPRRRRDFLTRDRLNAYIGDNLERKLLLVSAPAGYGKTSLLVDYAQKSGLPVCWYTLDPQDCDPVAFLEHLIEAIRQRFSGTCLRTQELLRSQVEDGKLDLSDIVGSLVNEIDEGIDSFFLLILDDYQNVDDSDEVNQTLDLLLRYLPDACQLVISGRSVPRKLTLTRLVGAGQVAGVGQEQLRFTPPEIGRLVSDLHGRQLSEMECERLARESEGWVTALVMAGPRMLDGVRTARPEREQLFAFLADEVLSRQPDDVQAFLVRSAVLDELSPELCDFVLERSDSLEMLDSLEAHRLFLGRIEIEGDWRRYHQVFRDFLRARQSGLPAGHLGRLHERAAQWFAAAGRAEDEIRHLLAAGRFDDAAERMSAAVEDLHAHGHWQTIVRWADALPQETLGRHPVLVQRVGTALTYSGDLPRALEAFNQAVAHYEAADDPDGLAGVLVRRAILLRRLGRHGEARHDASQALSAAGGRDRAIEGMARRALGGIRAVQGDMRGAVNDLEAALDSFRSVGLPSLVASACNDLSATLQWCGEPDRAIEFARAAVEGWEEAGNLGSLALALNNLGTAYFVMGSTAEAKQWLLRAIEVGRESGYRRPQAMAQLGLGDVLGEMGDVTAARQSYARGISLAEEAGDASAMCYGLAALAEAERRDGHIAAAREHADLAAQHADRLQSAYEGCLVAFVQGAIAVSQGTPGDAANLLARAAEGFVRLGARREGARAYLYLWSALVRVGRALDADEAMRRGESLLDTPDLKRSAPIFKEQAAQLLRTGNRMTGEALPVSDIEVLDQGARDTALSAGRLQVLALGEPRVSVGARSISRRDWRSTTARGLFLYLVDRPEGATRDELMTVFWPESDFVRARSSLHSALHRVRRAVGARDVVQTDFERYFVAWPGGVDYDVALLESELAAAEVASEQAVRLAALERAAALVRGPYLQGLGDDWCLERRHALEPRLTGVLLALGDEYRRLTRWSDATTAYRRVLAIDVAQEDAHRGLMEALSASGDRTRALRQFEACQTALAEELGVEPAQATVDLYRRIASQVPLSP